MIQYSLILPRINHTQAVEQALDSLSDSSILPPTRELIWWQQGGSYQQAYRYTFTVHDDEYAGKQWAQNLVVLLTILLERRIPVTVTQNAINPVYTKEY